MMKGEVYAMYLLSMKELIAIPTTDHIPPTKKKSKKFDKNCIATPLLGANFSIGEKIKDAIPHATMPPPQNIDPPHAKEFAIFFNK